jgi:predicted DNA binding CopG/RHH family protein
MTKKVTFGAKPRGNQNLPPSADEWVSAGQESGPKEANAKEANTQDSLKAGTAGTGTNGEEEESMKRLTIDIPKNLHTQIKTQCAARGVKMADEIRELLTKHFSEAG